MSGCYSPHCVCTGLSHRVLLVWCVYWPAPEGSAGVMCVLAILSGKGNMRKGRMVGRGQGGPKRRVLCVPNVIPL